MVALKKAYAEYLETQVPGALLEEHLKTLKYLCWSIPHKKEYTVRNWLGEYMGSGVVMSKRYVWLGNKGAVYVTKTPEFERILVDDTDLVLNMKNWTRKKYFNRDL